MAASRLVEHDPVWVPAMLRTNAQGDTRPGFVCTHELENGNGPCGGNVFAIEDAIGRHSCHMTEVVPETSPTDLTPAVLNAADARWSRPFRVVFPDGYVLHGTEFPDGNVVLDDLVSGLVEAATAVEHLRLPGELGRIVWADTDRAAAIEQARADEREQIALRLLKDAEFVREGGQLDPADTFCCEPCPALALEHAAAIARAGTSGGDRG